MENVRRPRIVILLFPLVTLILNVPGFSQYFRQYSRDSAGRNIGTTQRFVVGDPPVGGAMNISTASTDFAGEWAVYDDEERELGNYTGIPFNEAGRMRAETHDASEWSIPEFQCRPHPLIAQWRASGAIRISKEVDPVNRQVIAYHVAYIRGMDRPIYLNGRPHPPEWAPHTWYGFSTAEFKGNMLVVRTTHLKEGYFDWNGMTHSDQATVTEWWVRHGEFLTITIMHEDPVYLTEPFVQSVSYRFDPHTELEYFPCTVVVENPSGKLPHFLPGKNPYLKEYAEQNRLPYEATRGGAETMYPEYLEKLKKMKASN